MRKFLFQLSQTLNILNFIKKSYLLKLIQQYFYLPFIKPLRYFTKNEYVKKDVHFVNKKNHKTKFSP